MSDLLLVGVVLAVGLSLAPLLTTLWVVRLARDLLAQNKKLVTAIMVTKETPMAAPAAALLNNGDVPDELVPGEMYAHRSSDGPSGARLLGT